MALVGSLLGIAVWAVAGAVWVLAAWSVWAEVTGHRGGAERVLPRALLALVGLSLTFLVYNTVASAIYVSAPDVDPAQAGRIVRAGLVEGVLLVGLFLLVTAAPPAVVLAVLRHRRRRRA